MAGEERERLPNRVVSIEIRTKLSEASAWDRQAGILEQRVNQFRGYAVELRDEAEELQERHPLEDIQRVYN